MASAGPIPKSQLCCSGTVIRSATGFWSFFASSAVSACASDGVSLPVLSAWLSAAATRWKRSHPPRRWGAPPTGGWTSCARAGSAGLRASRPAKATLRSGAMLSILFLLLVVRWSPWECPTMDQSGRTVPRSWAQPPPLFIPLDQAVGHGFGGPLRIRLDRDEQRLTSDRRPAADRGSHPETAGGEANAQGGHEPGLQTTGGLHLPLRHHHLALADLQLHLQPGAPQAKPEPHPLRAIAFIHTQKLPLQQGRRPRRRGRIRIHVGRDPCRAQQPHRLLFHDCGHGRADLALFVIEGPLLEAAERLRTQAAVQFHVLRGDPKAFDDEEVGLEHLAGSLLRHIHARARASKPRDGHGQQQERQGALDAGPSGPGPAGTLARRARRRFCKYMPQHRCPP